MTTPHRRGLLAGAAALAAWAGLSRSATAQGQAPAAAAAPAEPVFGRAAPPPGPGQAVAIFAGGCFWCMEPPYDKLEGVLATTSGYSGGKLERPTYEQVTSRDTGHYEAIRVLYDPARVSYQKLLDVFWRNVDPVDGGGQFCDRGESYRTAIFALDAGQRAAAEASKAALAASGRLKKPIVTPILEAAPFWPAEDYHQDYYKKNPVRYRYYRSRCGRDSRLETLWGKEAGGA